MPRSARDSFWFSQVAIHCKMWKFEVFVVCALAASVIFLLSPYSSSSYAIKSTPGAAYASPDHNVVTMDALRWFGKKSYCWYWDKDLRPLGGPVESVTYPDFVVHCCRHPKAYYISVSAQEDDIVQELVPVIDRTSFQTSVYELSFCLAPLYGHETKWLMLTETIEHYKFQHVEHFYIYVKDIDDYSLRVLNFYVKGGEVETVVLREDSDRIGREFHGVGIQDCLQRSRYQSRYVLFSDLDERIVTMDGTPLREFAVKKFAKDVIIRNIRFTTRYIARPTLPPNEYKGDETLRKHLPTLVFHNNSAILPLGHTRKNIIDPRAVLEMDIHYVLAYFSDYAFMDIDTSEAEIRHYRELNRGWFKAILPRLTEYGNLTLTYYSKHLMEPLCNNVKRRLDFVYLRTSRRTTQQQLDYNMVVNGTPFC
ncbi:hypothetical protein Q1695_005813 [Nippostrongylus brasiliensis]|nr:hypothetical protein Q1695_005813 [Nippostrongylus brasiliensis]